MQIPYIMRETKTGKIINEGFMDLSSVATIILKEKTREQIKLEEQEEINKRLLKENDILKKKLMKCYIKVQKIVTRY